MSHGTKFTVDAAVLNNQPVSPDVTLGFSVSLSADLFENSAERLCGGSKRLLTHPCTNRRLDCRPGDNFLFRHLFLASVYSLSCFLLPVSSDFAKARSEKTY